MNHNNVVLTAEVILKGRSHKKSILEAKGSITSENVSECLPSEFTIEKAVEILEKYGFKILSRRRTGVTISGEMKLFEQKFNTIIQKRSKEMMEGGSVEYFVSKQPLNIPEDLSPYVDAVVLPVPPTFFMERALYYP